MPGTISGRMKWVEQGGWEGTTELLYINQLILKEAKTRWKNIGIIWIEY